MTDHSEDTARVEVEEEHPRGAMTVLLFYMLVIIGLYLGLMLVVAPLRDLGRAWM